jgi:arginyl-tRNA synthetase
MVLWPRLMGMNPRALADVIVPKSVPTLMWPRSMSPVRVSSISASIRSIGKTFGSILANVGTGLRQVDARRKGRKINVEYVSANPTGPMHVGHCRGAVVRRRAGQPAAFAGYAVTKEYYINDAGSQIDVLARSVILRYREALGEDIGENPGRPLSLATTLCRSARRLPKFGTKLLRHAGSRVDADRQGSAPSMP